MRFTIAAFCILISGLLLDAKPLAKKPSRSQLKEHTLASLEQIAHDMTAILKTVSRQYIKPTHSINQVPSLQPLMQLYELLSKGQKNAAPDEKFTGACSDYVQKLLNVVADIQEAVMHRVREILEDDGEGVFTALPYQKFHEVCQSFDAHSAAIEEFHTKLRKAAALLH